MNTRQNTGALKDLSPNVIGRNPENPRLIFRQEEMESLLVSIDTYGIQVPLTVYAEGDGYRLIDGERRWRCALKLNLRTVPALVQDKPTELQNLLLMYNIHALREQWDYFTIASKLVRVIELFANERGHEPNEVELSNETGLSRGQIRRCRLLLDLPEKYKQILLAELGLPKTRQKISEDFFIEMERALKTVTKRFPQYQGTLDQVRDSLIEKFRSGTINAVTDFRQLSKIATAVDNVGVGFEETQQTLETVFDPNVGVGIREAYEGAVEFEYDERKASQRLHSLTVFFDQVLRSGRVGSLDESLLAEMRELYKRLSQLLRS